MTRTRCRTRIKWYLMKIHFNMASASSILTEVALSLLGNKLYDVDGRCASDIRSLFDLHSHNNYINEEPNLLSVLGLENENLDINVNIQTEVISSDEEENKNLVKNTYKSEPQFQVITNEGMIFENEYETVGTQSLDQENVNIQKKLTELSLCDEMYAKENSAFTSTFQKPTKNIILINTTSLNKNEYKEAEKLNETKVFEPDSKSFSKEINDNFEQLPRKRIKIKNQMPIWSHNDPEKKMGSFISSASQKSVGIESVSSLPNKTTKLSFLNNVRRSNHSFPKEENTSIMKICQSGQSKENVTNKVVPKEPSNVRGQIISANQSDIDEWKMPHIFSSQHLRKPNDDIKNTKTYVNLESNYVTKMANNISSSDAKEDFYFKKPKISDNGYRSNKISERVDYILQQAKKHLEQEEVYSKRSKKNLTIEKITKNSAVAQDSVLEKFYNFQKISLMEEEKALISFLKFIKHNCIVDTNVLDRLKQDLTSAKHKTVY